jgi:hypothetical protein
VNQGKKVAYFEVAVGTDPLTAEGRTDVLPFMLVHLATNVTLDNLVLIPGFVYYVTVRAFRNPSVFRDASSDGVLVGVTGDATVYPLEMSRYQHSVSSLRFSWREAHHPLVGILRYEARLHLHGTNPHSAAPLWASEDAVPELGADREELLPADGTAVVYGRYSALASGLQLAHGSTYVLVMCAVDERLQRACTSAIMTVDTSEPVAGQIYTAGHAAAGFPDVPTWLQGTTMYTSSAQEVAVVWTGFQDPLSGITTYRVGLVRRLRRFCTARDLPTALPTRWEAVGNTTRYVFGSTALAAPLSELEFVTVVVEAVNGAGLAARAFSAPIVVAAATPLPGDVHSGRCNAG